MRIKGKNVDMAVPAATIPEDRVEKYMEEMKRDIGTIAFNKWFSAKNIPTSYGGEDITHEMFYSVLKYERENGPDLLCSLATLFLLYHPKIKETYAEVLKAVGASNNNDPHLLEEWVSQVYTDLFDNIIHFDFNKGKNITGYMSGKNYLAGAKRELTEFYLDNKENTYNSNSKKAKFVQKFSYEDVTKTIASDSDEVHGPREKDIFNANDHLSRDVNDDMEKDIAEKMRLIYEAAAIEFGGEKYYEVNTKVSNIDTNQMQVATFLSQYKGGASNWSDEELDLLYKHAVEVLKAAKAKEDRDREKEQEDIERD